MYMDWWVHTFNLPLKHPILQSYTFEELVYEYHAYQERKAAYAASIEEEADKIEEAKAKADEEWADQMEREEAEERAREEAAKAKKAEEAKKESQAQLDPRKDPANIKWMEEQIEKAKKKMGPEFGEDLKVSFDD
jgi:hypothetical protein